MFLVIVGSVIGVALLGALAYDMWARRRGLAVRGGRALEQEATHSRIDLSVPPFEPSREPGQQDWATYRARDRKRGR